jgi:hypothetical protein
VTPVVVRLNVFSPSPFLNRCKELENAVKMEKKKHAVKGKER